MIPTNIFHRVVYLAHGDHTATGTIIHVGGREYVATARHFAELLIDRLEIFYDGDWAPVNFSLIGHNADADVSVLALAGPIVTPDLKIDMSISGMIYGQDVYFMGFPFGLSSKGSEITRNFPIPFVKKAIVANFSTPELGADFWLDGYNNIGFSGGPIVSFDRGEPLKCTLRGFVCAYYTHPEQIDGMSDAESSTYHANSGLIVAANVERALTLIAANPNGPLVEPPFAIYPLSK